jgi:hypothetical protein
MDATRLIAALFSDLDAGQHLGVAAHENRAELLHLCVESLSLVDQIRAEGGLGPKEETQLHDLGAGFTAVLAKIGS